MTDADPDSFNLFDPQLGGADPHPHFARLRAECPVSRATDTYLVTTHKLVLEVVRDPETFSNRFANPSSQSPQTETARRIAEIAAEGWPRVPTLLTQDPPAHSRFRKLVSKAFTPRAINALEPQLRATATRLIDNMLQSERTEFVADFAVPYSVEAIAAALGVPDAHTADFRRWTVAIIDSGNPLTDADRRIEAATEHLEMQQYFSREFAARQEHPRDDILTSLVIAEPANGDSDRSTGALTMGEMLSIVEQLVVAGNETTSKLITEIAHLLTRHASEWTALKADPTRIPNVVEEALRLASPTQGMFRQTLCPTLVDGVSIAAGERVLVSYSSANRDESIFAEPDRFDPNRPNLREHLAFGKGTHYCIGAALARLEACIALEELAHRVDRFALRDENDFDYSRNPLLRGLSHLHLDLVPA